MKYREFGRNGLRASAVGLGCMGMSHTYGATADKKGAATQLADNCFYTTLQQQATLIGIKAIIGLYADARHRPCNSGSVHPVPQDHLRAGGQDRG